MIKTIKNKIYKLLRWTEKWTKTDMIYLARGGSWLTISKTISSILAFGLAIAYANLLSKNDYAIYKYALSIFGILAITTLPGMNTAMIRAVVLGKDGGLKKAIQTKFIWSIIGIIIGLIISVYYYTQNNYILGIAILIISIFFPFSKNFIFTHFLQGKKQFKFIAFSNSIMNTGISLAIIISLIIFPRNILMLLFIFFISTILFRLLFFVISIKKYKTNNIEDESAISYGKHLSLMNVLGIIASHFDKILIWHMLGPTNLAIYSFAKVPIDQIENFLRTLLPLAMPKLIKQKKEKLKQSIPIKSLKLSLLIIPLIIIFIIIAPYFFKIFFPQYIDSVKYSQYLSLSLLMFPGIIFSTTLKAHAQKKSLYIIKTIIPFIRMSIIFILTYLFALPGIIASIIIMSLIRNILTFYFFKKI